MQLQHHGIKGQKWGVRRFQKKDGSLTAAGKKRYSEENSASENQNGEKKSKGMSKGAKTAIAVGAAVVGTALLAYGGYRLHKSGKLDSLIGSGKAKMSDLFNHKSAGDQKVQGLLASGLARKISKPESVSETLSKVNPSKSRNNCYNCVVATIGRLCGLDITAKGDTQSGKGMRFDDLCKAMGLNPDNETQVRRIMSPSVDKLVNVISKRYKEGDCGAIGLSWNDAYKKPRGLTDAGHTLNWVVRNGKVEFMDGQAGIGGSTLYNFISSYMDSGKEASIARFANVAEGFTVATDILSRFAN